MHWTLMIKSRSTISVVLSMKSTPPPTALSVYFSIGVLFCYYLFVFLLLLLSFCNFFFPFHVWGFAEAVDLYQQTLRKKIKAQSLRTITAGENKGTPTDSCLRIQYESSWRDDGVGHVLGAILRTCRYRHGWATLIWVGVLGARSRASDWNLVRVHHLCWLFIKSTMLSVWISL